MKYELGRVEVHKHKRLPHWDAQHGIYFVTFNLFDALPQAMNVLLDANAQLEHIRAIRGDVTIAERQAIETWVRAKIGDALDETRYRLLTWC